MTTASITILAFCPRVSDFNGVLGFIKTTLFGITRVHKIYYYPR